MDRKMIFILVGMIVLISGTFLYFNSQKDIYDEIYPEGQNKGLEIVIDWNDTPLTDVLTGEEYKVSDFSEQVVVLESFAVWCPTCRRQQEEIKKLIANGDDSVHISIDVDPNEDVDKVVSHAEKNGFTWRFSVFPVGATKGLIKDFGPAVVNAPLAPMIIVCPDGNSKLLKSGVKTAGEIASEIAAC